MRSSGGPSGVQHHGVRRDTSSWCAPLAVRRDANWENPTATTAVPNIETIDLDHFNWILIIELTFWETICKLLTVGKRERWIRQNWPRLHSAGRSWTSRCTPWGATNLQISNCRVSSLALVQRVWVLLSNCYDESFQPWLSGWSPEYMQRFFRTRHYHGHSCDGLFGMHLVATWCYQSELFLSWANLIIWQRDIEALMFPDATGCGRPAIFGGSEEHSWHLFGIQTPEAKWARQVAWRREHCGSHSSEDKNTTWTWCLNDTQISSLSGAISKISVIWSWAGCWV